MKRPSVDVFVPCYNYGRYLRGCVDSVLMQEDVDVRVLILDDASRDDTPEIASDLQRREHRVEYVRHVTNAGHIATYNEGIEWATADYQMLLSADDLLTPGSLARSTAAMKAHPAAALAYGRSYLLHGSEPVPATLGHESGSVRAMSGLDFIRFCRDTVSNPVPTPSAVVRTTIQRAVGGYRRELPHTGDMELWLRLAAHGDVCALSACQAVKRAHGENMQLAYLGSTLADLPERWRAFEILFATLATPGQIRGELRDSTAKRFAIEAIWKAAEAFDRDDADSLNACLDFAQSIYPAVTSSSAYRRLRCKMLLGSRGWRWMQPLVSSLRGAHVGASQTSSTGNRFIGTWPNN